MEESNEKARELAERIALFRYGIISPIFHEREGMQNQYFKKLSEQEHFIPGIGVKKYSLSTFKNWLSKYRENGYSGLKPRVRKDKGKSRRVPPKFKNLILEILKQFPMIKTYTFLYRQLLDEGYIRPYDFSLQTMIKFMKDNEIELEKRDTKARRKFESPFINRLWMADFMHSFKVCNGKKMNQTYLFAIIDDHSRVIVGASWKFNCNLNTVEECLKNAILTYGIPQRFYCDNAKVFSSHTISMACAKLGIALIHSKPADPASRGKIERFFRTVRTMFMPTIDRNGLTLPKLNTLFQDWINKVYHKKVHQGIKESPMEKFLKGHEVTPLKRITKEELGFIFYRTIERKVKKDCTVSINGKLYEAPMKYMGRRVEIRYASFSPEEFFIFQDDKPLDKLKLLDLHENANQPHLHLNYSQLFEKEDE